MKQVGRETTKLTHRGPQGDQGREQGQVQVPRLRIRKRVAWTIPVCRHLRRECSSLERQWLGTGRPSEGFAGSRGERQGLLLPPPRSYVDRLIASVRTNSEVPEDRPESSRAQPITMAEWVGAEVVERLLRLQISDGAQQSVQATALPRISARPWAAGEPAWPGAQPRLGR